MKIAPPLTPEHEHSGDCAAALDQPPASLSQELSDMAITEGDKELSTNESRDLFTMSNTRTLSEASTDPQSIKSGVVFAMSEIRTLDETPIAPESNETDHKGSLNPGGLWVPDPLDDESDEAWIPVPTLSQTVEVKIYGAEETFFIKKDLLCSKSAYFKTALESEFLEAKTNKFLLVERLDLFQVFSYWLEQGNLEFMDHKNWIKSAEEILVAFVEIYRFADRRGVPALGDEILQRLDKCIRPGGLPVRLDVGIINMAWEHLPETCGLCRYLLAIEHDANRCNLPERPGVEYGWLSGYFTAGLLKLTKDDSEWWLTAMVQKQPVDMRKLHNHLNGLTNLDKFRKLDDRHWDKICDSMGLVAPAGCDKGKLRGHLRAMHRRWLRPWDAALSATDMKTAEEECPRPLVKEFFHNAVVVEKTKLKPVPTKSYSSNYDNYYD